MFPSRFLVLFALLVVTSLASADPFGPSVTLRQITPPAQRIEMAYVGEEVVVLWLQESVLRSTLASVTASRVIAESVSDAAIASRGDRALAVWTQPSGAVLCVTLDANGRPLGFVTRIGTADGGSAVALAYGNGRYLATWAGPFGAIYAALLDSSGGVMVPAKPVTTQSGDGVGRIAAASNGERFAVSWDSGPARREVLVVTLDENAIPHSMTPTVLARGAFSDIASDGDGFLVVWGNGAEAGARGSLLSPSGEVMRRVRFTAGFDSAPRVAWDGSAYTIAYWHTVQPRPGFQFTILTVHRFAATGTFVESLQPASGILFFGELDLIAQAGRVDIVWGNTHQTARVDPAEAQPSPVRRRVTRH